MTLKNKKIINWRLIFWRILEILILISISILAYKCFYSTVFKKYEEPILYIVLALLTGFVLSYADLKLFKKIQKNIDSNKKLATFYVLCYLLAAIGLLIASEEIKGSLAQPQVLLVFIISFELTKKLAEIRSKPQPNTIMIPSDRGDIKVELSPNGSGTEIDFTKPQQFIITSDDKTVKIHITSQEK